MGKEIDWQQFICYCHCLHMRRLIMDL